jgi:lysophospholipase L1-like esterase
MVVDGRSLSMRFNALGLRDDPIAPDDRSEWRILALGDSFTAGAGVEAEEAWPEQTERLLSDTSAHCLRVINAGVSGYSLRQIRLLAEELLPLLRPKLVVVGVYPPGADRVKDPFVFFEGTIVRQSEVPQIAPVEDGMLHSPFGRPWARSIDLWLDRNFYLGADLMNGIQRAREGLEGHATSATPLVRAKAERILGPLLEEVVRLNEVAASNETTLVILLVNGQEANGDFSPDDEVLNAVIADLADENGIPWVDPLPSLRRESGGQAVFRLPHDFHWSPSAHILVAKELAKALAKPQLLREPITCDTLGSRR